MGITEDAELVRDLKIVHLHLLDGAVDLIHTLQLEFTFLISDLLGRSFRPCTEHFIVF